MSRGYAPRRAVPASLPRLSGFRCGVQRRGEWRRVEGLVTCCREGEREREREFGVQDTRWSTTISSNVPTQLTLGPYLVKLWSHDPQICGGTRPSNSTVQVEGFRDTSRCTSRCTSRVSSPGRGFPVVFHLAFHVEGSMSTVLRLFFITLKPRVL